MRIHVSAHACRYGGTYMCGRVLKSICTCIVIATVVARAVVRAFMQYLSQPPEKSVPSTNIILSPDQAINKFG